MNSSSHFQFCQTRLRILRFVVSRSTFTRIFLTNITHHICFIGHLTFLMTIMQRKKKRWLIHAYRKKSKWEMVTVFLSNDNWNWKRHCASFFLTLFISSNICQVVRRNRTLFSSSLSLSLSFAIWLYGISSILLVRRSIYTYTDK